MIFHSYPTFFHHGVRRDNLGQMGIVEFEWNLFIKTGSNLDLAYGKWFGNI